MLQQIVPQHLLASLRDAGEMVACALGVRDGDHIGIFDLIVDPLRRNKGYGAALMAGMLNWGQMQGAHVAYLQVVEENVAARHLYDEEIGIRGGISLLVSCIDRVVKEVTSSGTTKTPAASITTGVTLYHASRQWWVMNVSPLVPRPRNCSCDSPRPDRHSRRCRRCWMSERPDSRSLSP